MSYPKDINFKKYNFNKAVRWRGVKVPIDEQERGLPLVMVVGFLCQGGKPETCKKIVKMTWSRKMAEDCLSR
jgi:hypothetical protein